MSKILKNLKNKKLIHPPTWLPSNTMYLVIMGSEAYGVSTDSSDKDIYGFAIPPKDIIFPHIAGIIKDFNDDDAKVFKQWQQHHVFDNESSKQYDFSVYSIVRYFRLVMENNPNMIDSLFVPERCVLHSTKISEMIRDNRNLFLHKGCWNTFKGYALSQMHKIKTKGHKYLDELLKLEKKLGLNPKTTFEQAYVLSEDQKYHEYYDLYRAMINESKRSERVKVNGYDVKFAYHIVRLISECEQIFTEGTLELDRKERREMLKSIRRGEWSIEQIDQYFQDKIKVLEKIKYEYKVIPDKPPKNKIKQLLLNCIEEHYGNLNNCIVNQDKTIEYMREINKLSSEALNNLIKE